MHRSVSDFANKLITSYGKGLNIDAVIRNIRAYVDSLISLPKHDAAKHCIPCIIASDYTFTDSSNASTRQLLALAFRAIHDDTKWRGELKDALTLFVEDLY